MREINFDGIVGPTHNYGGLSLGNVASMTHEGIASNPRAAALEGLAKMRFVWSIGGGQAVLPPHERPSLSALRRLGFGGTDEEIIARAARASDGLYLRLCSSAAAMWTANAATVCPSSDAEDRRVHLTVANLRSMFHRSIEPPTTYRVFARIFADPSQFVVHEPLPGGEQLADEGAANHARLATEVDYVHLFAWGRGGFGGAAMEGGPRRFPARQTREASETIARLHRLDPSRCLFPRQHPAGIDAGAFHTDVLAVGAGPFWMMHELAFVDSPALVRDLERRLGPAFRAVVATDAELPVAEAVAAYPFNSEIVTAADGSLYVLAPEESRDNPKARTFLSRVAATGLVREVYFSNLRQSMRNGGGPACLRLRVPLEDSQAGALGGRVLFDESLDGRLVAWVERHYRDRLVPADLGDPRFARECMTALDELSSLLGLGSIYDFQREPGPAGDGAAGP